MVVKREEECTLIGIPRNQFELERKLGNEERRVTIRLGSGFEDSIEDIFNILCIHGEMGRRYRKFC